MAYQRFSHMIVQLLIWNDRIESTLRWELDWKTRQERKLTLLDLNLKMVCIDVFRHLKPLDVPSCLFCAITSKEEEMIGSRARRTSVAKIKKIIINMYCLNFIYETWQFKSSQFVSYQRQQSTMHISITGW